MKTKPEKILGSGVLLGISVLGITNTAEATEIDNVIINVDENSEVDSKVLPPVPIEESQEQVFQEVDNTYYPLKAGIVTKEDYKEILEPIEKQKQEAEIAVEVEKNTTYSSESEIKVPTDTKIDVESGLEAVNAAVDPVEETIPEIQDTASQKIDPNSQSAKLQTNAVGFTVNKVEPEESKTETIKSEINPDKVSNLKSHIAKEEVKTLKPVANTNVKGLSEQKYLKTMKDIDAQLKKVNFLLEKTKKSEKVTYSIKPIRKKFSKRLAKQFKVKSKKSFVSKLSKKDRKSFVYILSVKGNSKWTRYNNEQLSDFGITNNICRDLNSNALLIKDQYGSAAITKTCYVHTQKIERTESFNSRLKNSELNWDRFYRDNPELIPKDLY